VPFRTKNTYSGPGIGTTNFRKRTHSGPGGPPAGTRQVPEKTISEVPVVTTSPSGQVTTSGFSSPKRAQRATRKQRTAIRIERRKTRAFNLTQRSAAQQRRKTSQSEASLKRAEKRIGADSQRLSPKAKFSSAPKPASTSPTSKPKTFKGLKTAGSPSLKELQVASSRGKLKTNQRGYLTTPAVRKTVATVKGLESKARDRGAPLPGLTPQASHVARKVLARGAKAGATRKEKLAAAETGLVESGFENLPGGDADSQGWRQERTSIYGTGPGGPRNVKASASRFFQEAKTDTGGARGRGQTAGQLAQTIQGSAYPERYDERKPEANAIVKAVERGSLKPAQRKKLKAAKAEASRLGLKGLTKGKQRVSKQVLTRFNVAKKAAAELTKAKIPYVWGGGHGGFADPRAGLDCSGAVSFVLHKMGVLKSPLTSGDMGSVLKPGPGLVSVFYNPEHTFMRIGNQYWGTSVGDNGMGGLGPHPAPSGSYLAQYSVGHVAGLGKKVAVALGIPLTGGNSFPGMTLSPSGTTATVESGGATQTKPGFSSRPIRLTQAQKARRTFKRLKQVGVGEAQPAEEASTSSTLAGLERKYGVKTG
jgi:cell wall-associated NlpC family hydrolase